MAKVLNSYDAIQAKIHFKLVAFKCNWDISIIYTKRNVIGCPEHVM